GNMEQIMEIIRLRKPDFGVLSGDDALTMPLIAAGADGVISVVANAFPEKFSRMVHASLEGDYDTARKEHYDLLPITKMFFEEGNPGGVKIALRVRGICSDVLRLPLVSVSEGLMERIVRETKRIVEI
ncbi:MAG: dihydrodipicolinate synthase family protein, partial [Crocinitomicaceae bacterium]